MTTAADRDLVELLRQRVKAAREVHWTATHDAGKNWYGALPDALRDLADALTNPDVYFDTAVVQAVARELVGTADLAAYTDEQARPVVRRILDGELGQEAALAMTRVVLDLTHARGQVQALERELKADRGPWQVVDTEGGELS